MSDIEYEIKKMKYQIRILADTIDSDSHPMESLILSFDWDDGDLNKAHDIFEKYDHKVEAKEDDINWTAFEHDLREQFGIGYQEVKLIILAFYKNRQWTEVCYRYAKANQCMEFDGFIREYENEK